MPNIDLSILNQRQTPAFYASSLATRPAFGFAGRIFIDTDSPSTGLYRDTGAAWVQIADPGAGTTGTLQQVTTNGNTTNQGVTITAGGLSTNTLNVTSLTSGSVLFVNPGGSITQDNVNLFWDDTNNHFGINTNVPGTALDVHHDQSTILQLNQETATNDTRIAFQNSGSALWRIGNFYNAGANDWGIFDVVGAAQPFTIKKTTGQVLIGTSTVGSGKLVVASSTGDNGVQIVGASAPSLRIDNAESGPTKRAGLGISTATNNFIQGSVDRDFCMFNGSTTASPILFGIYDTTNVQEAARISAARNFLIGTTTDNGNKLQILGSTSISNSLSVGGTTAASGTIYIYAPEADGSGSVNPFVIRSSTGAATQFISIGINQTNSYSYIQSLQATVGVKPLLLNPNGGNVLIGTTTDAGQKLQVNGTGLFNNNLLVGETPNSGGDNIVRISNTGATLFFTRSVLELVSGGGLTGHVRLVYGTNAMYVGTTTNSILNFITNNVVRASISNTGVFNLASIPTSAAGLSSGDVWSNLGILNIVP